MSFRTYVHVRKLGIAIEEVILPNQKGRPKKVESTIPLRNMFKIQNKSASPSRPVPGPSSHALAGLLAFKCVRKCHWASGRPLEDFNRSMHNLAKGHNANNVMPFTMFPSNLQSVVKGDLIHIKPNASSTGPHSTTSFVDRKAIIDTDEDNDINSACPQEGDI
ncbi:hypothetical protein OBBRIDRAFT_807597 [Obba rivulosa]|uniref:Uncharacterized protein n=1 Tax=Obba rivulosa TaxID=1052685 RepID=A0A8E2ARE8_9APHY|nr:hypothetical protein OBBRIDRAFT_807597 [Obba rivulosa]